MIPLLSSIAIEFLIGCCANSSGQLNKSLSTFKITVQGILCVLAVNITLKIDNRVTWKWSEGFWPLWLLMSIVIACCLLATFFLVHRFYLLISKKGVVHNEEFFLVLFINTNLLAILLKIIGNQILVAKALDNKSWNTDIRIWLWVVLTLNVSMAVHLAVFHKRFRAYLCEDVHQQNAPVVSQNPAPRGPLNINLAVNLHFPLQPVQQMKKTKVPVYSFPEYVIQGSNGLYRDLKAEDVQRNISIKFQGKPILEKFGNEKSNNNISNRSKDSLHNRAMTLLQKPLTELISIPSHKHTRSSGVTPAVRGDAADAMNIDTNNSLHMVNSKPSEDISLEPAEELNMPSHRANHPKSEQRAKHSRAPSLAPSVSDTHCNVCYANPQDVVFMPCGHGGLCNECASDILITQGNCCFCRHPIHVMYVLEVLRPDVDMNNSDFDHRRKVISAMRRSIEIRAAPFNQP